jgi:hypothetical protein
MQSQYPDRTSKTTTYGAPVKSSTVPNTIDNKGFRSIGDPISILDRGSTIAVKPSLLTKLASMITGNNKTNTTGVALEALDNDSYDAFGKQQIYNTTRDTFVYKTDD